MFILICQSGVNVSILTNYNLLKFLNIHLFNINLAGFNLNSKQIKNTNIF